MEVIVVSVIVRTNTGGNDFHCAVMVDILRAACCCAQMPAGIVLVRRLIACVYMAELIGPDGCPAAALLGQHHNDRAALVDTVLAIQVAQRNGNDQLVLVVRLAVQICRFELHHGGVVRDSVISALRLNLVQRLAEITFQSRVIADVQNIGCTRIVSIAALELQITLLRVIKHEAFPAVTVEIARRNRSITLGIVAVELAHPAVISCFIVVSFFIVLRHEPQYATVSSRPLPLGS